MTKVSQRNKELYPSELRNQHSLKKGKNVIKQKYRKKN